MNYSQTIRHWFDKKSPHQDCFGLGLGNIYVFFSRQGLLYLGLLILTFVVGTNYANNLVLGLFFYLGAVWLVGIVVTFLQLSRLEFELSFVELSQAHSICWVEFEISSRTQTPARQIRLSFDYDKNALDRLNPQDRALFLNHHTLTLSHVQKAQSVRLPIIASKRGVFDLPRLSIQSVYPLGITQAWSYGFFVAPWYVYPTPKPFDSPIQTQHANQSGAGIHSVSGVEDFDRLDTYIPGQNLSSVSWAHVARGMGMLSKHFGETAGISQTLDYYAMPSIHHEDKLSELAYLLTKQDPNTPFRLNLPTGLSDTGSTHAFIQDCFVRLAKEP